AESAQGLAAAIAASLQHAQRQGARPAALLLTGGGAELDGLDALLASVLRAPAEVARPAGLVGAPPPLTRPAYAVATGLLLLGARQHRRAGPRATTRSVPFMADLRRIFTAKR
ncbi:MAG: hypothetical protein ACRDID_21885, partial [Ktedonobacterales bacterium]